MTDEEKRSTLIRWWSHLAKVRNFLDSLNVNPWTDDTSDVAAAYDLFLEWKRND